VQTSTINPIAVMETAIQEVSAKIDLQAYDEHWVKCTCNCGKEFLLFAKRPYSLPEDEERCANDLERQLLKEEKAGETHHNVYEIDKKSTHAIRFS
jgi:hypothetical protein